MEAVRRLHDFYVGDLPFLAEVLAETVLLHVLGDVLHAEA